MNLSPNVVHNNLSSLSSLTIIFFRHTVVTDLFSSMLKWAGRLKINADGEE